MDGIKNVSGINEEVYLNFEKDRFAFKNIFIKENLVTPSVIYGTNGSGKTSILKTLVNISEFINEGNEFSYEIHIENKTKICYEVLLVNEESFVRDNFDRISDNLSILKLTGVSPYVDSARSFLMRIAYISSDKVIHRAQVISWGETLEKYSNEMIVIARDISLIRPVTFKRNDENTQINVDVYYENNDAKIKLNYYKHLSSGTRDFYETLALILDGEIKIWVIDEIEKTFHPDLLIKLLIFIVENYDVQIICSSHNTNLMKYLRPDQLFFTRHSDENTRCFKLSDEYPGLREINNIEKLYYGGSFNKT